jgi:hypothetical protein
MKIRSRSGEKSLDDMFLPLFMCAPNIVNLDNGKTYLIMKTLSKVNKTVDHENDINRQ